MLGMVPMTLVTKKMLFSEEKCSVAASDISCAKKKSSKMGSPVSLYLISPFRPLHSRTECLNKKQKHFEGTGGYKNMP